MFKCCPSWATCTIYTWFQSDFPSCLTAKSLCLFALLIRINHQQQATQDQVQWARPHKNRVWRNVQNAWWPVAPSSYWPNAGLKYKQSYQRTWRQGFQSWKVHIRKRLGENVFMTSQGLVRAIISWEIQENWLHTHHSSLEVSLRESHQ